jgi:hypothetical protein
MAWPRQRGDRIAQGFVALPMVCYRPILLQKSFEFFNEQ